MRVRGVVTWYHPELQVALVERDGGFTVGTIEQGQCALGDILLGDFLREDVSQMINETTDSQVVFLVEANALTEDQASELLGYLRD
jgi:hypothetical protein